MNIFALNYSISYYHRHRHGAWTVQRNALLLTTLLRFTLHRRQP